MTTSLESVTNPVVEHVLDTFHLTPDQHRAAAARGRDVIVTAGAGSGKTRTLVARYLSLLAEGFQPRRVTAVTFTEKAAREMRSRVRSALSEQIANADAAGAPGEERLRWIEMDAQMDSARIGTIHSLCAEILRSHPAEAGVDPRFEVLEEGLAAALRLQAVSDTLDWLVGEAEFSPLLSGLTTSALQKLLRFLLDRRLEMQALLGTSAAVTEKMLSVLAASLNHPSFAEPLAGLRYLQSSGHLRDDAGDRLADQILEMLAALDATGQALAAGDWIVAAQQLFQTRRKMLGGSGKKDSAAKNHLAELKAAYDQRITPWLGGKNPRDTAPDAAVETLFVQVQPLLKKSFDHLLDVYQASLRQRQALDFDDLEAGAARLLAEPPLRRYWQAEIDALLVDEFQDTNARQREIVLALCGEIPGRLFVVGDARQSIYRFRQADVTVFRRMQQDIQLRGGLVIDLNLTFRAHTPLLQAAGDLLADVIGDQPDPEQPFFIPFSPLVSDHDAPYSHVQPPHVEFVMGDGEDAETARPVAARALAQRLLGLQQANQIEHWDDVALLFRASTGFPAYENAFEDAGIPFVTIAGQGFYNRPEIRDVLNLLRALADPWDDLAMAGLLRSPAFGLSDDALYHLRWLSGSKQTYWGALQGDLASLPEPDQGYARRALELLSRLQPWVDRLPVSELLKRLVDGVDYRAILASAQSAAARLWRNLDKLLADAQVSRLVNVRAFLEYLDTLRDVGAREGEAPADAGGAVRLMTIHKAKGLEFPLVVLADAARQRRNNSEAAYLLPETGLAFRLDRCQAVPLLYRLAAFQDSQMTEAEEKRLLYVALTRAKEKLLLSGHVIRKHDDCRAAGWLDSLVKAGNVNLNTAFAGGTSSETVTPAGHILGVWTVSTDSPASLAEIPLDASEQPEPAALPLYRSLVLPQPEISDPEPGEISLPYRATGDRLSPPAGILGRLVHYAIRHWMFPDSPAVAGRLQTLALEAGLADPAQRLEAVRLAKLLLRRLQTHPLWREIDLAGERYHEVPYAHLTSGSRLDTGYMDLLYRGAGIWQVVDFKTDSLRSLSERQYAVEQHRQQMRRYAQAAVDLLRAPVRVRLCFLDDQGKISLQEMPG